MNNRPRSHAVHMPPGDAFVILSSAHGIKRFYTNLWIPEPCYRRSCFSSVHLSSRSPYWPSANFAASPPGLSPLLAGRFRLVQRRRDLVGLFIQINGRTSLLRPHCFPDSIHCSDFYQLSFNHCWNIFFNSILGFYLVSGPADNVIGWTQLSAEDRASVKADYAAAGISLMVSAFGSTETPTTCTSFIRCLLIGLLRQNYFGSRRRSSWYGEQVGRLCHQVRFGRCWHRLRGSLVLASKAH